MKERRNAELGTPELAGLDRRKLVLPVMRLLIGMVIVALVILALPDLDSVRQRLNRATAGWLGAAASLEASSVVAFALAFHRTFARDLSWWNSASLATAAQGVNALVPAGGTGGLAATGVVMVRFGMSRDYVIRRMLAVFVVTDVLTNVAMVIIAGLGVATGALPGHAAWEFTLLPAVIASLLCAAVVALAQRAPGAGRAPAGRVRRLARSGPDHVLDGLRASSELLRTGDPLLVLGAVGFVLLDLGAFAAAFAALGSRGLPLGQMMLAYSLGQVGSVVPLPGTTEGGLLGVFVLYGAPLGAAASAIIVYRAAQIFIPLGLGVVGAMGVRAMLGDGFSPEGGDLRLEGPSGPR